MTDQFEKEFAERFGARHAVAVSSGTAALHLAIIAAGVTEGRLRHHLAVFVRRLGECILYERGIPVFVDIDPDTLTIDPEKTIEAIRDLAQRRKRLAGIAPSFRPQFFGRVARRPAGSFVRPHRGDPRGRGCGARGGNRRHRRRLRGYRREL